MDKIFLHYTQEELDRNYDQRMWAANVEQILAERTRLNHAAREEANVLGNIPYGTSPDETLDVFPAAEVHAPILVFVHGGAWRNFSKEDVSLLGPAFAALGVHCVILNFTNLPKVRMPEMVDQVRRGVVWTYMNAASFGGDADRLFLLGNSSGGHLAATVLLTDWGPNLPHVLVKGAACVSGIYDLRPAVMSKRGDYIKLDAAEIDALSPPPRAAALQCSGRVCRARQS
jgi:arylformamidase